MVLEFFSSFIPPLHLLSLSQILLGLPSLYSSGSFSSSPSLFNVGPHILSRRVLTGITTPVVVTTYCWYRRNPTIGTNRGGCSEGSLLLDVTGEVNAPRVASTGPQTVPLTT